MEQIDAYVIGICCDSGRLGKVSTESLVRGVQEHHFCSLRSGFGPELNFLDIVLQKVLFFRRISYVSVLNFRFETIL